MIYFVACPVGKAIKIGTTSYLDQRLKTIRRECPFRPPSACCLHEYLGSLFGSVGKEEELHDRFDHLFVYGEWFRDTAELREAFYDLHIEEILDFLDEELRRMGISLPADEILRHEIRLREFEWLRGRSVEELRMRHRLTMSSTSSHHVHVVS